MIRWTLYRLHEIMAKMISTERLSEKQNRKLVAPHTLVETVVWLILDNSSVN